MERVSDGGNVPSALAVAAVGQTLATHLPSTYPLTTLRTAVLQNFVVFSSLHYFGCAN